MSDRAGQADGGDAAFDAAIAHWSADSALSSLFRTPDGIVLVLDPSGERIVHATEPAWLLRTAIADRDGRFRDTLRLPDQIRGAGLSGRGVRLVRIRFDARGVARPTACLLARATFASEDSVLLLAPAEPLPALRPVAVRPRPIETAPASLPEPVLEDRTAPSGRIVWRSDAAGVLTHVSGAPSEIAESLLGRSWHALGADGVAANEPLLAAIEGQRTFRALVLTVRTPAAEHDIEFSGAPSARPSQPFAGFSGFGLARGQRPRVEEIAEVSVVPSGGSLDEEPPAAPAEASPGPATDEPTPVIDEPVAAVGSQSAAAAQFLTSWGAQGLLAVPPIEQSKAAPKPASASHAAETAGFIDREEDSEACAVEREAPKPHDPNLSTQEHAAFREIARALGARFAGDDDLPHAPDHLLDTDRRGAVMAFPGSVAQNSSAAIDAAIVAALDRLPAGVLVHRNATILYVNRHFLRLTGYPDREAMQSAGGLDPLLNRDIGELRDRAPNEPVSVRSEDGTLTPLMTQRSKVDWDGGPAELLLVRAASEADHTREQIAKGLFQTHDAMRERDTQLLLDHIEEGVATLDETGRVLGLNRSAAVLLSSEAREVVGGTLADLFTPDSEPAVAKSLREARDIGLSEPREATPRTRTHRGALRLRITQFSAANGTRLCATLREPTAPELSSLHPQSRRFEPESAHRGDFLARVRHEIHTPLNGIVGNAEAILTEKLGPLGSERYREYLREIQASGQHVLGVLEDLLDLARIEAGRGDLTFTDIALNDVVSGCIAQMQPQAARDRIVVRTSLSPDLKPLVADERSMRQATLNVIANAIRLTEAGGQVIVSTTTAERGEIAFRVRDTGVGMTPEEIENALEPFRRIDPATRHNGSGLGLTLTKALVEANRGRLRITSRKNEGTLVEMLFPPPQALSA